MKKVVAVLSICMFVFLLFGNNVFADFQQDVEEYLEKSQSNYIKGSVKVIDHERFTADFEEDEDLESVLAEQDRKRETLKTELEQAKTNSLLTLMNSFSSEQSADEMAKEVDEFMKEQNAQIKDKLAALENSFSEEVTTETVVHTKEVDIAVVSFTTSKDNIFKKKHTAIFYYDTVENKFISENAFLTNDEIKAFEAKHEDSVGATSNRWLFSVYLIVLIGLCVVVMFSNEITKYSYTSSSTQRVQG